MVDPSPRHYQVRLISSQSGMAQRDFGGERPVANLAWSVTRWAYVGEIISLKVMH